MKRRTGMIIGKFMPPHCGHQYLIDFGRELVETLYVIVESVPNEPIPSELRYQWVREMFPSCEVLHLQTHQPQDPSETPDFWSIWKKTLLDFLPEKIDVLFASEPYGNPLAEIIGAQFMPVDISRTAVSISATQIRANPQKYWQYIPAPVRPYFARKICIFGPESCGKTTLTKQLADHFGGTYVPEYARTYLENQDGELQKEDLLPIALGQSAQERALERQIQPLMFCDTDPLTTTIWSEWLYQDCDAKIEKLAKEHQYDLYLLLDVDVPWVKDMVRYVPENREQFFTACKKKLEMQKRNYVIIRGSWETRWKQALEAVQHTIHQLGNPI